MGYTLEMENYAFSLFYKNRFGCMFGMVWFGMVWYGLEWFSLAWSGMV